MINFLIRIIGTERELVSLLPLLNFLSSKEGVVANIIADEGLDIPSSWLPPKCKLFVIPDNKKKSVFGIHHYAANLHDIFNVDYYFDFINDFQSAFVGLAFRAKKRIGLKGGPKSYLYNTSLERFPGNYLDEQKLSVLEYVKEFKDTQIDFNETEVKKELHKVCIDLTNIDNDLYRSRIENLIQGFEELSLFGFVPSEAEEDFNYPDLAKKIELFCEHKKDFFQKQDHFDVVITDSLYMAEKTLLSGNRALLIMNEGEELPVWSKQDSSICALKFLQNDLVQYGIDEEKELRVLSELEDYLINYYELRLEPS